MQKGKIVFLGANIDSEKEASKIGIDKEFAASYKHNPVGVRMAMCEISHMASSVRKNKRISKDWKKNFNAEIDNSVEENGLPKWLK